MKGLVVALRRCRRPSLALLWLACAAVPALAQDAALTETASRTVVARRLTPGEAIRVDGVLDEAAWRDAVPASRFAQREPDNGNPATEGTEVRILFDASRLIIGAEMFDQQADGVLANQMQRDGDFNADDRFIIALDTFLDRRNGYFFAVNPAGAMLDALINPAATNDEFGAAINRSWDGIWTARVRRTARGWSAEIDIPFRTLNFDPSLTAWGINFQRTIRRRSEEVLWTAHDRSLGVTRMATAGRLEGLSGLSQGVGLDVKPYLVGNVAAAPGRGRDDAVATGDVGVDVLYNVTPALRATVSINTDFAETEVDQRQVNLTRFPLFFEEKRDFFLQGASYFDFARELGQQVTPFFSRRIGLDSRGLPQPIDVGAKLTGQAGAFDIGALYVRTRQTLSQPAADVAVARVRRRLLRQSYIGALYTRRADHLGGGGGELQTAGVDFSLRTSAFRGSRTVDLSGWYLLTTNPLGTGGNIGRGLRLQYPNDPLYLDVSYRELQPNYNPAVGFLQRVGFRRFNPETRYTWHYRGPLIRSQQARLDPEFVYDMDNRLLTRTIDIKPLTLVFNDGSTFEAQVSPIYDRLERPFNISPGVTLPASAAYSFTRYQLSGSTASHRIVSASATYAFGDFYSGSRRQYVADLSLRPRRGVALNLGAEHNVLDLAEGQFTTDVYRAIASTQFSPSLSLGNNLQYDSVSRSIGWQMRLRWIQRPGNDLFLVYTHNWQEFLTPAGRTFERLDNRLATKAVYTLRF